MMSGQYLYIEPEDLELELLINELFWKMVFDS